MFRRALAVVAALALLLAVGASFAAPSPARAQTSSGCPAGAGYWASGTMYFSGAPFWRIHSYEASNLVVSFSAAVQIYVDIEQVATLPAATPYNITFLSGMGTYIHFVRSTGSSDFTFTCTAAPTATTAPTATATATTAPTATATATTAPTATATATTAPTATEVPSVTPFRYFLPHVNRGSDSHSHAHA